MMFNSIRSRLTVWSTVISGLLLVSLTYFIYWSFVNALHAQTEADLAEMCNSFVTAVSSEQGDEDSPVPDAESISETINAFRFGDYQFLVQSDVGNVIARNGDIEAPPPPYSREGAFRDHTSQGKTYRVYDRSLRLGFQSFHLFVFHPLADQIALERRLWNSALASILLGLLITAAGSYFLIRWSFRPVAELSRRVDNITSHTLHARLPLPRRSRELGSLTTAFNRLLDRLDKAFDDQRRFMADASHELRTPLAIVRGESDVALLKEVRDLEDYKASLRIINDESRRLTKIVDDLFILARADSGQVNVHRTDVYADEILSETVLSVRSLAEQRFIAIDISTEELMINGDETLLRRLFLNLLDNAIKYNYAGGHIAVTVAGRSVKVSNTGEPILDDQVALIFERFYRADKARSVDLHSQTGGAGLGLSIVRVIAELHHATIGYSRVGIENVFRLDFQSAD